MLAFTCDFTMLEQASSRKLSFAKGKSHPAVTSGLHTQTGWVTPASCGPRSIRVTPKRCSSLRPTLVTAEGVLLEAAGLADLREYVELFEPKTFEQHRFCEIRGTERPSDQSWTVLRALYFSLGKQQWTPANQRAPRTISMDRLL